MSIRSTPWPAGVPCWADLQTPDLAAAERFYGAVLGWSFVADSWGEDGGQRIAQRSSAAVAGIGPVEAPGMPPAWTLWIATDDIDAAAAAVEQHGGTMRRPPQAIGGRGSLGLALDPTGAVFGIWAAGEHIGAELSNEPGGMVWEDLRTSDPELAWPFYEAVFGYETRPLEMAGPTYRTFHPAGDDAPLGGMGGMMGDVGSPPHWLVYFAVEDAVAAQEAARSNGGSVASEAFTTPFGVQVSLLDPAGARFMVIQPPADMPRPDRS